MSKEQTRIESQDTAGKFTSMTDSLYESGLTTRLRVIQEIGNLIQWTKFQDAIDYNDRTGTGGDDNPLYHTGIFVVDTINELFSLVETVENENREEFHSLREQLEEPEEPVIPMTPEEERENDMGLLEEIIDMGSQREREDAVKFVGLVHSGMVLRLKAEGKLGEKSEPAGEEVSHEA
jgi:hypothetical protein